MSTSAAPDLAPFWPTRRARVTDEWCRRGVDARASDATHPFHPEESPVNTTFTPRAAVAPFLTHLDAVVQREVGHVDAGAGRWELEAERIAAEVGSAPAILRDDLQRHRIAIAP